MQGGGALGAFQAGVYEALHEARIEPDWIVGTSIGAINGALIAGNTPANRLQRLRQFWDLVADGSVSARYWNALGLGPLMHNLGAVSRGIPGFFEPNPAAWMSTGAPLGVTNAAYYGTRPLRETLASLMEFSPEGQSGLRLTLGAVNVQSGRMRYFDSRHERVGVEHVLASGALPPAFPAVMIDGSPYWDGGIYSNTPIEAVMDDQPRRDSLIFSARLWQQEGEAPASIGEVMSRLKDIQFSSRADHHIEQQREIHHLRHVVRELGKLLPDKARSAAEGLLDWGCGTVMHVLEMRVPELPGEDHTKDLDFTAEGIAARWQAGYDMARQRIVAAPWKDAFDPIEGVVVHR
ncbi:patatin-like phospholipase family protein [Rhodocyclaceae bacterium SMB388]